MRKNKSLNHTILLLCIICLLGVTVSFFVKSQTASAQYWAAIPPYNTLWPLWSPVLSPVSRSTGLPTPLVTSLTPSTQLPVQPALTWVPSMSFPWLLYNTPLGMVYYDPYFGIDFWPPGILTNLITGLPITLSLPAGYEYLAGPYSLLTWLVQNIASANSTYQILYPTFIPIGTRGLPTAPSVLTTTELLSGISALPPAI